MRLPNVPPKLLAQYVLNALNIKSRLELVDSTDDKLLVFELCDLDDMKSKLRNEIFQAAGKRKSDTIFELELNNFVNQYVEKSL